MDLQLFLAVNAMAVSAMVIGTMLIYRTANNFGWIVVNAAVLAVGLVALWCAPDVAGWLVGLVFVPLVIGPVFFSRLAQRKSVLGRGAEAARYARWAAWLHPSEANRVNADVLAASLACSDTDTRALKDLGQRVPAPYRPLVNLQEAAMRRDWAEVLAHVDLAQDAPGIVKPLEIRALGETGRREAMVRAYAAARELLAAPAFAVARLTVLVFGGRPDGVHALLERPLKGLDDEVKAYWMALACLYSQGHSAPGRRALDTLATTSPNPATRRAAQRHLDAVAAHGAAPLSDRANTVLDVLEQRTVQTQIAKATAAQAAPLTTTLVVLNLLAFAAEVMSGGSENSDTLIKLGAVWPPDILEHGQWWRLLSACFLHFGPIHVATNMFVLWMLGRMLEPLLGLPRMLVIYLVGGIASSAFVLWLMFEGDTGYGLLVGASGAIFALLGAEAAIVCRAWYRDRANFDSRKLTSLLLMLSLQIVIDLSVPNVSFAAHGSGFVTGMAIMLAWPYVAGLRDFKRFIPGPRA
jgi:rhomboid protease GluP